MAPEILVYILAPLCIVLVLGLAFVLYRRPSSNLNNKLDQATLTIQKALADNRTADAQALMSTVTSINETISRELNKNNTGLSENAQVLRDLLTQLGEVATKTGQLAELGSAVTSLNSTLTVPKLRGTLGELWLEDLLTQLLPPDRFETQYQLGTDRVDAVIKLGATLIPVDAKFPLESYARLQGLTGAEADKERRLFKRSVKDRIDEIRAKYIRPDEGTADFAMMYLPAESIYAEAFLYQASPSRDDSLLAYAMQARVVPVSPHTFYAYLSAVLHGLKGMRLNEHAKEIQASLSSIELDLERFFVAFEKVGTHLGNASKQYVESVRLGERVQARVEHLHNLSPASSPVSESQSTEVASLE